MLTEYVKNSSIGKLTIVFAHCYIVARDYKSTCYNGLGKFPNSWMKVDPALTSDHVRSVYSRRRPPKISLFLEDRKRGLPKHIVTLDNARNILRT
jgi:hypothetical protein